MGISISGRISPLRWVWPRNTRQRATQALAEQRSHRRQQTQANTGYVMDTDSDSHGHVPPICSRYENTARPPLCEYPACVPLRYRPVARPPPDPSTALPRSHPCCIYAGLAVAAPGAADPRADRPDARAKAVVASSRRAAPAHRAPRSRGADRRVRVHPCAACAPVVHVLAGLCDPHPARPDVGSACFARRAHVPRARCPRRARRGALPLPAPAPPAQALPPPTPLRA